MGKNLTGMKISNYSCRETILKYFDPNRPFSKINIKQRM